MDPDPGGPKTSGSPTLVSTFFVTAIRSSDLARYNEVFCTSRFSISVPGLAAFLSPETESLDH
jgi:hypothetical protein